MVDLIRDVGVLAAGIIDSILDFSKIEAGQLDARAAVLDLPAWSRTVCDRAAMQGAQARRDG